MGRALFELDRLEEAARAYRQSIQIAETSQHHDLFVGSLADWADPAYFGLAAARLRQGKPLLALEIIEKLQEKFKEYDYSDGWINLIFYRVFQANRDPRAAKALEEAHRGILERAARISDEAMRRSFLENIAENREILALWEVAQTGG
jgi:tetratricopeptide (TPR) repeat protein